MKVKLILLDKTTPTVEFQSCNKLEDVCKWLNLAVPFITISEDTIINTNQICKVKPLDSIKAE